MAETGSASPRSRAVSIRAVGESRRCEARVLADEHAHAAEPRGAVDLRRDEAHLAGDLDAAAGSTTTGWSSSQLVNLRFGDFGVEFDLASWR